MTDRPAIPGELRDIAAYGSDGELVVLKAHRHDPRLQSFIARLGVTGADYDIVIIDDRKLPDEPAGPSQPVEVDPSMRPRY